MNINNFAKVYNDVGSNEKNDGSISSGAERHPSATCPSTQPIAKEQRIFKKFHRGAKTRPYRAGTRGLYRDLKSPDIPIFVSDMQHPSANVRRPSEPTDECTPEIIFVSGIGFALANMTSALILAFEECRFEVGFTFLTPSEFRGGSTLQSPRVRCPSLERIDRRTTTHFAPAWNEREEKGKNPLRGFIFPLLHLLIPPSARHI